MDGCTPVSVCLREPKWCNHSVTTHQPLSNIYLSSRRATHKEGTDISTMTDSPGVHLCTTPDCGKLAQMACPTCVKLGVSPPSRFCAQDCFKSHWDKHKLLHKKYSLPREFKGYKFTGPLRAYEKSPKREVPAGIAKPDYAGNTGI